MMIVVVLMHVIGYVMISERKGMMRMRVMMALVMLVEMRKMMQLQGMVVLSRMMMRMMTTVMMPVAEMREAGGQEEGQKDHIADHRE